MGTDGAAEEVGMHMGDPPTLPPNLVQMFQPLMIFPGIESSGEVDMAYAITQLCTPGSAVGLDAVLERYKKLNKLDADLMSFAQDLDVLKRIGFSLRGAKISYLLGNYLSTIALCGFVAEMTSILVYESWFDWHYNTHPEMRERLDKLADEVGRVEDMRQSD